jgi:hypothetical protein
MSTQDRAIERALRDGGQVVDPASTTGLELRNGVWAPPQQVVEYTIQFTPSLIDPSVWLSPYVTGGSMTVTPPAPKPPLPVRKQVGGIVAYRGWAVGADARGGVYLESVTQDTKWDGPVLVADAPPVDYEPWGTGSGHGIYAYNKPRANGVMEYDVWGEVMLYGRVVVHRDGYRAEKAMIRRIVISPKAWVRWPGIEDALTARYGCEVSTDYRTILQQTGEDIEED